MGQIDFVSEYLNKNILITGGTGFLGRNIALALVSLGANITLFDSSDISLTDPIFGDMKSKLKIVLGDIRDEELMKEIVKDKDIIFNLAAKTSPSDSGNLPFEDLDINCKGHLVLLEACRENNPDVKIVFSSSRMVYGKTIDSPVTENHPTDPLSLYGIHKLAGEKYHFLYGRNFGIRSVVLRITNPYGEGQRTMSGKDGLPGWFMRLAMENKPVELFGDGKQLRDYIYIDDIVNAFLSVAVSPGADGKVFNCGSGISCELKEMAETIIKIIGQGSIVYVPWPENYEQIESGDFRADISKLLNTIKWQPYFSLEGGLKKMFGRYEQYKDYYFSKVS